VLIIVKIDTTIYSLFISVNCVLLHLVGHLLTHIQNVYDSLIETKPITGCQLVINYGSTKLHPEDGDGVIPYKSKELSHLGCANSQRTFYSTNT